MVFGMVAIPIAAVAVPTGAVSTATSVIGLAQGINSGQGQAQEGGGQQPPDKEDPRLEKFNIFVECGAKSRTRDQVEGKQVFLRKGKLYLDDTNPDKRKFSDGHPFSGFYLDYPFSDQKPPPRGLVSTISYDPPELNWIFADKDTSELKYGGKSASLGHLNFPWDWTEDQRSVMLDGWEGIVALQEGDGEWALCYDRNEDHLKNTRGKRRVLEVNLNRRLLPKPDEK